MDLEKTFYSVNNFQKLFIILSEYSVEKYDIDINDPKYNIRRTLYQIMEHIYSKRDYRDINILNSDVLKESKKYFKTVFKPKTPSNPSNLSTSSTPSTPSASSSQSQQPNIRDLQITNGKILTSLNERPQFNAPSATANNVNNDYEKIKNNRYGETTKPNVPEFNFDGLSEKAEDPEIFNDNLKKLAEMRNSQIPYHVPESQTANTSLAPSQQQQQTQQSQQSPSLLSKMIAPVSTLIKNISSNIELDRNNNPQTTFEVNTGDFIHDRNQFFAETIRANQNINPSAIYVENALKNQQLADENQKLQEVDSNRYVTLRENNIIKNEKNKIFRHLVSISSYDKDWNDTTDIRYKYKVKFNNITSNEYIKTPVYSNNEYLPNTTTLNITGWTDNIGFHPPYDASLPKGELLYYTDTLISNSKSLNIDSMYKNVASITLTKLLLPMNDYIHDVFCNINCQRPTILSLPYILVQIEEFDGIYRGTNNVINKTFCKLIYDGYYNNTDSRGYIEFSPVNNEKKEFSPNPLSSLNSLSISILKPDGTLLNNKTDKVKVKSIDLDGNKLKITTDIYFHKFDMNVMDKITINKFNLFDTDNESYNLEKFINSSEGHFIGEIGTPLTVNGFTNMIYIDPPGTMDYDTGIFTIDPDIEILLESQINEATFIINVSMQNYMEFKIETLEGDPTVLKSLIV